MNRSLDRALKGFGQWGIGSQKFFWELSRETCKVVDDLGLGALVSRIIKIRFRCNICGLNSAVRFDNFDRETPSCHFCGSTVRMRGMTHGLSLGLFGKSIALPDFPVRKDIRGIGMSDSPAYARLIELKLDYTNTFYHQEPFFDITSIDSSWDETLDFILSTDVYEHVIPPVERAFQNTFRALKPGGFFVFSVPYSPTGKTLEHFPNLHKFEIEKKQLPSGDKYVLYNQTIDGNFEHFEDLIFHGGPGETLEMRQFSLPDLYRHLQNAGFERITVLDEDFLPHGIHWPHLWSLPMLAHKPK